MKCEKTRSTFLLAFLALITIDLSPLYAQEPGARYLIITHDSYCEALQPLATWKTQKGMKSKIARLSETGTDSVSIRNYIINAYDTWTTRPEYLLFVGNKYQIPFPRFLHSNNEISYSDNYYANVAGDFNNELHHGRFWASDTTEAKTCVAKVLAYERDLTLPVDSLWYRKGTTIVNEYEPGQPSSAELYWADARYAHARMLESDYVHIDSFSYLLGHTGDDVVAAINDGRTYILYRGTGFNDWEVPFYGINTGAMTNGHRMPIVLSATCATIEGIGADWTVAGTPDEPKGLVGFYGTTTAFFAAAEMRSELCRGTTASLFSSGATLGAAAEAGRLKYYFAFNDLIEYHSWSLLGDPEMRMWTKTPRAVTVTHDPLFVVGACTVHVHVERGASPVRGALVCAMAMSDTTFYQYGYTNSGGNVQFFDTLNMAGDSVRITVTGRNLIPYTAVRPVTFAGGPHVLLKRFWLFDSLGGNGNGLANPAEDIEIPFWLMNWGDNTAHGVYATLEQVAADTFFTLYDTLKYVGEIAPYDSALVYPDGHNIVIDTNAPDQHEILLRLRIRDSGGALWTSYLAVTVAAPGLSVRDYYINDHVKFTPVGDTTLLYVELLNGGTGAADSVVGRISSSDSFLVIIDSTAFFGAILPDSAGSNQNTPFAVASHPAAPVGHSTFITLEVYSGVYAATCTLDIQIGQRDYLVWDPDPNHSSGPLIHALLDSLYFLGDYAQNFPYGFLSLYKSAFICAGVYPANYVIKDTSRAGSEIAFYIESQGGRVFLEGGDVWYDIMVNHGYDFRDLFGIRPLYNSIGLFTGVTGCAGTFTQDMWFEYAGEAAMIDYIDTLAGSQLIFRKTNTTYGCGVCANGRTVGLSFEMSGLIDTTAPSTKTALLDSIMDYFGIPPLAAAEHATPAASFVFLFECSPNPSRNSTNIRYMIQDTRCTPTEVRLGIYDVSGRLVRSWDHGSCIMDHESVVVWDGTDERGRFVPQGVYFIRLEAPDVIRTIKTVLLR